MQPFHRTAACLPQLLLRRGGGSSRSSLRLALASTSSPASSYFSPSVAAFVSLPSPSRVRLFSQAIPQPALSAGGGERARKPESTAARVAGRADAFDPIPDAWPERYPPVVFIGNLAYSTSDEQLRELLEPAEGLDQVYIVKDFQGLSKGMGFASFHTPEQAFEALKRFNGIYFQRRMLRLRPSRLFGRRGRLEHGAGLGPSSSGAPRTSPTKTLYIGNLDWEVTPKQFKDAVVAAAAEAGETSRSKNSGGIIGVRLAVDRDTGWPRGFAHVEFNSVEAAQAAFPKFREFVFNGRAVVVDYALPGRQRGGSGTANSKAESEPARPAEKVKAVGGDQTDGQDNGNAEKKAEGPKADGEVELKGVAKA